MNQWAEQGDKKDDKPKENTPELTKTTAWAEQGLRSLWQTLASPKPRLRPSPRRRRKLSDRPRRTVYVG